MNKIKTIGLWVNPDKDPNGEYTAQIIASLTERQIQFTTISIPVCEDALQSCDSAREDAFFQRSDLVMVLGGDGTLLAACKRASAYHVPVMGINLGRRGFLSAVELSEYEMVLDTVISGNYEISSLSVLQVTIYNQQGDMTASMLAVNDIGLFADSRGRIMNVLAQLDGQVIGHYFADGILISTPTGSSAYSLSAGGPLVAPGVDCMLFTPVCAHSLYTRPIVLPPSCSIQLQVTDNYNQGLVVADGHDKRAVPQGGRVMICQSERKVQLIKQKDSNYFSLLRTKLNEWNGVIHDEK